MREENLERGRGGEGREGARRRVKQTVPGGAASSDPEGRPQPPCISGCVLTPGQELGALLFRHWLPGVWEM